MTTVKSIETKHFGIKLIETYDGRYFVVSARTEEKPDVSGPYVDLSTANTVYETRLNKFEEIQ